MFIIRLDDASERMDTQKWSRIEALLNRFDIKPIVGIIPNNKDPELIKYDFDSSFWKKAVKWQEKGWTISMHGYEHLYHTMEGGINPVQKRSEFAGIQYKEQLDKIKRGYEILKKHSLSPTVFFAPSHTFDENTIKALLNGTSIRIISDTIANDVYYYKDMFFIPQQSGYVRNLPFKITTFCYHPNKMTDTDFEKLERFITQYRKKFISVNDINLKKRKQNLFDKFLRFVYFIKK